MTHVMTKKRAIRNDADSYINKEITVMMKMENEMMMTIVNKICEMW